MRTKERRRAEARARQLSTMIPIGVGILLVIGVGIFYNLGTPVPDLDDRLCPKNTGPVGATVLLLDTSDPLTAKHKSELERLLGQVASEEAGRMGVSPGELLAVYELTQNPGSPEQLIEVCRPFQNPKNRTWRDGIHRGWRFAERDWERFEDALTNGFPKHEGESHPTTPLLETMAFLVPRHATGKRGDDQFRVHLIVVSDLLQHTDRLSHYRPYPEAKDMKQFAPDLLTDLTNTRVSLFRLERPKYERWQTERHYYWWTEVVREMDGQIEWQDAF